MKNKKTFLEIIALLAIIGLSFTALSLTGCGEEGELGSDSSKFTMTGKYSEAISVPEIGVYIPSSYYYDFINYSTSQVTVSINGESKTMKPYATLTGIYASVGYSLQNSSASVSYAPSSKVRFEGSNPVRFYDK